MWWSSKFNPPKHVVLKKPHNFKFSAGEAKKQVNNRGLQASPTPVYLVGSQASNRLCLKNQSNTEPILFAASKQTWPAPTSPFWARPSTGFVYNKLRAEKKNKMKTWEMTMGGAITWSNAWVYKWISQDAQVHTSPGTRRMNRSRQR